MSAPADAAAGVDATRQMTFDELLDHSDAMQLIAFCLDAPAALALSATCSRAPRFRLTASPVQEADQHWRGPSGVYTAFCWQPLELQSHVSRLHTAYVACAWRDQGWGNQKGMLSVVVGEDGVAPGDYKPWPSCVVAGREPAPHPWSSLRLAFKPEADVATGGWRPHRLFVRVGGGGGHELRVRDLVLRELRLVLPGDAVTVAAAQSPRVQEEEASVPSLSLVTSAC